MPTVTLASLQNLREELVNSKYYLNIRSGYMAPVTLHCSYGDSGQSITFYIFDGGDALDLTGATVSLHGTRRDGASFGPITCTVSSNAVTFSLASSMTAVEGGGIAEFTITKNSATIGTCNFGILVEQAVFPNGVAYDSDPSVYQDILEFVQTNFQSLSRSVQEAYNTAVAKTEQDYQNVMSYVDSAVIPSGAVGIDASLTIQGAAADAKATGEVRDNLDSLIERLVSSRTNTGTNIVKYAINNGDVLQITSTIDVGIYSRLTESGSDVQYIGALAANQTKLFDVTANALYLRIYFVGAGTVTVENMNRRVPELKAYVDSVNTLVGDVKTLFDYSITCAFNLMRFATKTTNKIYSVSGNNITSVDNQYANLYSPIDVTSGTTYYVKNIIGFATFLKYGSSAPTQLTSDTSQRYTGSFTASGNGQIYISVSNNSTISPQIFTDSEEVYEYGDDNGICIPNNLDTGSRIFHVEKDGSGDFTKLVDAIEEAVKYRNSTVYVGAGTWDIIDEYGSDYISTISTTKRGLYLKNGIHVICSSKALITCEYTGTNSTVITWLSAFNSGEGGFTLENAHIRTKNIRYTVHDERDQDTDAYSNTYKNCIMEHNNAQVSGASTAGYPQCIGGGLGTNGLVNIESCIFNNTNPNSSGTLVSYHNSEAAGLNNICVKDCYFRGNGRLKLSWYGASTDVSTAIVTNNSFGQSIMFRAETEASTNVNMEMLEWNNIVRS